MTEGQERRLVGESRIVLEDCHDLHLRDCKRIMLIRCEGIGINEGKDVTWGNIAAAPLRAERAEKSERVLVGALERIVDKLAVPSEWGEAEALEIARAALEAARQGEGDK